MNQRIKKLAEQAHSYACEYAQQPDYNEHNPYNQGMYKQRYDSKFAELIVQECGVALSPMLRDMISRGQAVELIKKHFGVES
jgi:hypothetical protein